MSLARIRGGLGTGGWGKKGESQPCAARRGLDGKAIRKCVCDVKSGKLKPPLSSLGQNDRPIGPLVGDLTIMGHQHNCKVFCRGHGFKHVQRVALGDRIKPRCRFIRK